VELVQSLVLLAAGWVFLGRGDFLNTGLPGDDILLRLDIFTQGQLSEMSILLSGDGVADLNGIGWVHGDNLFWEVG
jgi:hypothetical protein